MSFLDFIGKLSTTLSFSITFGTVILYGALGEVLTEKGGNLNLGVPGIMYIGAIASLAGALKFEAAFASPNAILCILVALLCGFAASALAGLLNAFLTISLRTNQNVTGLTLTIFGTGIGNYIGGSLGSVGTVCATNTSAAMKDYIRPLVQWLDGLTDKLNIGSLLFRHGFMVYFGILLAIALWNILTKTRTGLSLRAVGENAATADAAGLNVNKFKYLSTCIGAGISGLGGTFYVMEYIDGLWETSSTIEALGWLAVALVIFATWKSLRAIWGSYLFGVLYWAYNYIPGLARSTLELFKMLPYVVTILVLLMVSMRKN